MVSATVTKVNFVSVLAVCDLKCLLQRCIASDRHHLPCAARKRPFTFCRTCIAWLYVQLVANNAPHRECALWAIPAPQSASSHRSSMFGLLVRCSELEIPIQSFQLSLLLLDNMRIFISSMIFFIVRICAFVARRSVCYIALTIVSFLMRPLSSILWIGSLWTPHSVQTWTSRMSPFDTCAVLTLHTGSSSYWSVLPVLFQLSLDSGSSTWSSTQACGNALE